MDVSQLKELKALQEENRRLKQMYADLALDNKILRDVIEKKTLEPEVKKEIVSEIVAEYEVSITRACRLMDIHRSYHYYTSVKDDADVEDAIRGAGRFGEGFWKTFKIIRKQGHAWDHKNLYRVYKSLHFKKRSRLK